jgi:hypothetical protein
MVSFIADVILPAVFELPVALAETSRSAMFIAFVTAVLIAGIAGRIIFLFPRIMSFSGHPIKLPVLGTPAAKPGLVSRLNRLQRS